MRRALTALSLLLGLPLGVAACLWDRDTPAEEAKGMPEIVAVLTGRFERKPPLFYEIRLRRVTAEIATHPEDLAAYDDAGVACDRLGRGDDAIAWMEKKWAQLEKLDATRPEVKEHQYRYHANLGTFLVHRWARQGADRTKIDEVKAARDEIAKAIAINPNAHFGREIYQLGALEWIVDPPKVEDDLLLPDIHVFTLPNILGPRFANRDDNTISAKEADDVVKGLAGLVVLGNAWESVDIFHALERALEHDSLGFPKDGDGGRTSLAYLAWLRCRELIDAGKGSMLPDAPRGEKLKESIREPNYIPPKEVLDSAFVKLRAEAEAWHTARTAFMMRRLEQGLHPDTDRNFWNGYTEPPAPGLPAESSPGAVLQTAANRALVILACLAVGIPVLAVGWAVRRARARRRKARPVEDLASDPAERFG
jgi:hypothetical protein